MLNRSLLLSLLLLLLLCTCDRAQTTVTTNNESPQLTFALDELKATISALGTENDPRLAVSFSLEKDCCAPGGFKVKPAGNDIAVVADDDNG